jgi:hypothetical protein
MPLKLDTGTRVEQVIIKQLLDFVPNDSEHPEWLLQSGDGKRGSSNIGVPEIIHELLA